MMRWYHYLIIMVGMFAMALGVRFLFYQGYLRFNYPSKTEFPIRGIDISHHQEQINWSQLKQHGLSFIFIKATEGGDFKDAMFAGYWKGAQSIKLRVGAYHFYSLCRPWQDQLDNFTQTVAPKSGQLPPAVDLEFGGNCLQRPTKQKLLKEVKNFLESLEEVYRVKPIIYVTQEFYEAYLIGELLDYPLWFRDIYGKPKLEPGRSWTFWQYANRGRLKGISSFVDLNVFRGDQVSFEKLLQP